MVLHVTAEHGPTVYADVKRIADGFKKLHTGSSVMIERWPLPDTSFAEQCFLMSDGKCLFSLTASPTLGMYQSVFRFITSDETARMTFHAKEFTPERVGPDQITYWERENAKEFHDLQLTDELREHPGMRNKPGTFYRKLLLRQPEQDGINGFGQPYYRPIYIEKVYMDMLSPDLDELEDFLFEASTPTAPIRVSDQRGVRALIIPFAFDRR